MAAAVEERQACRGQAQVHHTRRVQPVVRKERSPGHGDSQDGLGEAHAADLPDLPATLEEGKERIQQKQEGGGEYGEGPGSMPSHRSRGAGVPGEKVSSHGQKRHAQDDGGDQIPAQRFLKDGGEPRVRDGIAFDASIAMKREMSAFVRGHLQDHEGEAQLKGYRQRYKAEQRVVVPLLDRGQKPKDQQDGAGAAKNLRNPRQHSKRNSPVQPQQMLNPKHPPRPPRSHPAPVNNKPLSFYGTSHKLIRTSPLCSGGSSDPCFSLRPRAPTRHFP